MLNKLLGSKKDKDKFSLELKEEAATQDTPVEEATSTPAETPETPEAKEVTTETTPAPTPVVSQSADTPDWVKLLYKKSENGASKNDSSATFADKYLLTISSRGRRRPGASMSQYIDMASQAKTPQMRG